MYRFIIIPAILLCLLPAQNQLKIQPEISQQSFLVPFTVQLSLTDNIMVHHRNTWFHIDHPRTRYAWWNDDMTRDKMNAITDFSFVQLRHDEHELSLGRMYNGNQNRLNGVFFSSWSPSVDQFTYHFMYKSFQWDYKLGHLGNRVGLVKGEKAVIRRWLVYRKLTWDFNSRFTAAFSEMIISTGAGRGIEPYFLTPFGLLLAEEIHEKAAGNGIEDSDNGYLGFEFTFHSENFNIYTEWIIDEFQIDKDDRKVQNDIFGFMTGFNYRGKVTHIILEYAYASPWLYLHHGYFTSPERHGYPLGLRSPHSQSIDLLLERPVNQRWHISGQLRWEERGLQTLQTVASDAGNPKIDYFDFAEILPLEAILSLRYEHNSHATSLRLFHNWMQSDETAIMLDYIFTVNF